VCVCAMLIRAVRRVGFHARSLPLLLTASVLLSSSRSALASCAAAAASNDLSNAALHTTSCSNMAALPPVQPTPGPSIAAKAVRIHATGGIDQLVLDDITVAGPVGKQVLIEIAYAGINYIDTYHRTGLYKLPLPAIIGREGAGQIIAVGPDAKDFAVGDRVVFFASDAYATHAIVDSKAVVKLADEMSFRDAATLQLQGLTAHAFITDAYRVKSGDIVLVQAAAGGTGALLVQMAKIQGATVIGTVGSADKVAIAKEAGADHVINYNEQDFKEEVLKITNGVGVHAVYDGVGKSTFDGSMKSLRKRGTLVTFGNASGPVPPVDVLSLTAHGSIFLTRPTVAHFVEQRSELEQRVKDVHQWFLQGKLKLRVAKEFSLAEAKQAHEALESRKYAGKIILKVKE